jgi:predicted transcriptional regulator
METTNENTTSPDLETHVAEIVSNYRAKNQVAASDLPALITTVYQSLQSLGRTPEPLTPAVPIRQSVSRDYVVCLECGWRGSMLRGHLVVRHGLTRDEYRAKWALTASHPLTAPAYSARRAEVAKQSGLGQRTGRSRKSRRRVKPGPA